MDQIVTVSLRLENDAVPESWLVTSELESVLGFASAANRASPQPEVFDLTFTTMLYGFLRAADACSSFFQSYGAAQGLDRRALLARKGLSEQALTSLSPMSGVQGVFVCTVSAKHLLENADGLRLPVAGPGQAIRGPIDVRHLMGAYIYQPAGHTKDLESIGISRVRWSDAFREWSRGAYPQEASFWDRVHGDTFRSVASAGSTPQGDDEPVLSSRSNRIVFDNDLVLEKISLDRDRLHMAPEVRRLARLLAARDIHPPVALGLFGRWGSGKSFFMGMLRTVVDQLAQVDDRGTYAANAVQITFNAWHYQDSSLWASLALRIFERIAENIAGKDPSETVKKRQEVHAKLESSVKRRKEAEARRDTAVARRAVSAAALERAQQQRMASQSELSAARLARVWKTLARDASFGDGIALLRKDVAALGLNDTAQGIDDIERMRSQLQALDGKGQALIGALGASFRDVRSCVFSCIAVAAVIGVLAAFHWAQHQYKWVPASTTLYQLLTVVGAALAWMTRRLNQVSSAARNADALRQRVAIAWAGDAPSNEEARLASDVEAFDAAIQKANNEIAAADQRTAEAEAEIQRIDAGGLVYDFLTERRSSNDYLSHIGLISTIRQDFERLGTLLADLQKGTNTRPIDRIILYIDDLDRCDPDKVVEVLQAVHLLLAFDIFNVVVGVDPRWLERSLNEMYGRTMTQDKRAGQVAQASSPFRAQNYLEKIFQISYSLGAMNETAFGRLVGDLVPTRSEVDTAFEKAQEDRKRAARPETMSSKAGNPDAPGTADRTVEGGIPQQPAGDDDVIDLKEIVGTLFFEDFEEEFLKALYAFIETPRLAKRLVNIYRLLRIRASEEDFEEFLSGSTTGTYRAALVLLAINIGYPSVGRKLLLELSSSPSQATIQDLVNAMAPSDSDEVEQAALEAVRTRFEAMTNVPSELAPYTHWAPQVGCYSFDWHVAMDSPAAPQVQRAGV